MRALVGFVAALAVALFAAACYMGLIGRITIREENRGPLTFVYRDMSAGEMGKVGAITTALDRILRSAGVTRRKPLDVFYPDGHGEVGFAVDGARPEQLNRLAENARVREIPEQRFMVTEFPWRNRLSFIVGFIKVEPALTRYRESRGYQKLEAFALNDGHRIVYMQPVVGMKK